MAHTDSFIAQFNNTESLFAQKALDYLDGCQIEHVIKQLNDPYSGRRDWQQRGLRPLYRNITNKVVEKSGLLFKDGTPTVSVYQGDDIDTVQSQDLQDLLDMMDWNEFFINFDSVVRLLKSAVVLIQHNEDTNKCMLDILHKGNAIVKCDPITYEPIELIYRAYEDEDANKVYFRVYTPETVYDYVEETKGHNGPSLISAEPNPYGMIPVVFFYDTKLPRAGKWNKIPRDLIMINESYNIHLVDLEYAASWSVHQTLFTNCRINGESQGDAVMSDEVYKSVLPRQTGTEKGIVGGLSRVVTLDTMGVENPFVQYKGPELDLLMPTRMFSNWVRDYAEDWSVRIKADGEGTADSGFQLIVEEMPNLELRQQRARMFERGLRDMFEVIKVVTRVHGVANFSDDAVAFFDFPTPALPVDKKNQEEIWSIRIAEGRATPVDYFVEVYKLSREEAEERVRQIDEFNQQQGAIPGFAEEL